MDRNTPFNKVAFREDIERMWKEKFGLSQSPLERMGIYIADSRNWRHIETDAYYYFHPEFRRKVSYETNDMKAFSFAWMVGDFGSLETQENNFLYTISLYYHQTELDHIDVMVFSGGKKEIVLPCSCKIGGAIFYYYIKNSINYLLQLALADRKGVDHSKNIKGVFTYGLERFAIPVIDSYEELLLFESSLSLENNLALMQEAANEKERCKNFYILIKLWKKFKLER
jgi:hypothetical protein